MSLPSQAVDRIFARMLVRYGVHWLRMWDGIDIEQVKADWANVLDGLTVRAIVYGLDSLPEDKPPTALKFRSLCRAMPADEAALLRHDVKPNPEALADATAKLAVARKQVWNGEKAKEHVAALREQANLSAAQRDFLKRVGEVGPVTGQQGGSFTPIPKHLLPPGMRDE